MCVFLFPFEWLPFHVGIWLCNNREVLNRIPVSAINALCCCLFPLIRKKNFVNRIEMASKRIYFWLSGRVYVLVECFLRLENFNRVSGSITVVCCVCSSEHCTKLFWRTLNKQLTHTHCVVAQPSPVHKVYFVFQFTQFKSLLVFRLVRRPSIEMFRQEEEDIDAMESESFLNERQSIRDSARQLKKYGSTCNHVRNNDVYIRHELDPSDTLQGIALKYGCTVRL